MQYQRIPFDPEDNKSPNSVYSAHAEIRHPVKCVCPGCGMGHVLKLLWQGGTGIPGIYCIGCQEAVRRVDDDFGKDDKPFYFSIG